MMALRHMLGVACVAIHFILAIAVVTAESGKWAPGKLAHI